MTDADTQLLAAVINRLGQGELIHVLQNIFERLEALEPKADESSPSGAEGEETGSEEGESSSSPSEEPVSQEQVQRGY